ERAIVGAGRHDQPRCPERELAALGPCRRHPETSVLTPYAPGGVAGEDLRLRCAGFGDQTRAIVIVLTLPVGLRDGKLGWRTTIHLAAELRALVQKRDGQPGRGELDRGRHASRPTADNDRVACHLTVNGPHRGAFL